MPLGDDAVDGGDGAERSAVVLPAQLSAVVAGPDGEEVAEEITYMGPDRLFGIVSRPSGPAPSTTVILLNSGRIDHIGPGRLWVELARSWAGAGVPVVRVDLAGLGDSPARPGRSAGLVYSPEALDDVAAVAHAVSPADPSAVVLMGLCSGAWHSVQAALTGGARGVVAINLVPPSPPGDPAPRSPEAAPGMSRRGQDVRSWLEHRLRGDDVLAFHLRGLARKDIDTLVVAGSYEGRQVRQGEAALLWRMEKKGGFRIVVLPDIDHTLFTQGTRRQVLPLLTERVMAQCAPGPRPDFAATR